MAKQTPSQTVGPWFAYGLLPESYGRPGIASDVLAGDGTHGERMRVAGQVLDGAGAPVPDALIEIWQADAEGHYAHPADARAGKGRDALVRGFGRAATDAQGCFQFTTIKPGRVPGRGNALQAPHINVIVLGRGLLSHLYTRIYFSDEAAANADDPVLMQVEPARRGTLIAQREASPAGPLYRLDIRLQGEGETVFFEA